jgi:hypothetical protein
LNTTWEPLTNPLPDTVSEKPPEPTAAELGDSEVMVRLPVAPLIEFTWPATWSVPARMGELLSVTLTV